MTTAQLIDAALLALIAIVAGWCWLEFGHLERRGRRHRTELDKHAGHLTLLRNAIDNPPTTTHAPMPPARVSPEWQERWHAGDPATWADVLPPNHVLPAHWTTHDVGTWSSPGDTLTMPSRDTMRLATTTAKLRPPTIAPPADVLDALHRSGHPMTRRELAEVLERSDWELTAELRDLIHAGRITVASTAHNTEAAYIPTTTGVPR